MKSTRILYAIQGTGNGHISRALEIVPALQKIAEVDVLISGSQWELLLPFPIKYRFHGLGFVFGKKGGVDLLKTYLQLDTRKLLQEIQSLPVENYDLVISDFEPVSSWACLIRNKPCVALSNQVATLHPLTPKPESSDFVGKMILEHYAPSTSSYGFHFQKYDDHIYTPIIRRQVREAAISNNGHVTVYLPSYSDGLILHKLRYFKNTYFDIFSKHIKNSYRGKNYCVTPLNSEKFTKSICSADGILCNAGFGTSAEALFLGKKLLVVPMKNQYEQACNAASLASLGVTVIPKLNKKHLEPLSGWISGGQAVKVNYPDETTALVNRILNDTGPLIESRNHKEKHLRVLKKLLSGHDRAVA